MLAGVARKRQVDLAALIDYVAQMDLPLRSPAPSASLLTLRAGVRACGQSLLRGFYPKQRITVSEESHKLLQTYAEACGSAADGAFDAAALTYILDYHEEGLRHSDEGVYALDRVQLPVSVHKKRGRPAKGPDYRPTVVRTPNGTYVPYEEPKKKKEASDAD